MSVDTLEGAARQLAANALAELNAQALALQAGDRDDAGAAERFRFGVYFYRAPQRIDGDDKA